MMDRIASLEETALALAEKLLNPIEKKDQGRRNAERAATAVALKSTIVALAAGARAAETYAEAVEGTIQSYGDPHAGEPAGAEGHTTAATHAAAPAHTGDPVLAPM